MVNINCLLNTSFLSERQQNDPDVSNDKRQTSSESSSLQSEPVVSSNAFMVQSGVCLKRAEPVNTVCVMVVFPSLGNELQMRSFLESLDSEHSSSATSVKVKVPAMLIDAHLVEEHTEGTGAGSPDDAGQS